MKWTEEELKQRQANSLQFNPAWQAEQLRQFVEQGWPNRHWEDWKYLNLSTLSELPVIPAEPSVSRAEPSVIPSVARNLFRLAEDSGDPSPAAQDDNGAAQDDNGAAQHDNGAAQDDNGAAQDDNRALKDDGEESIRITFINGQLSPQHSNIAQLPEGVTCQALCDVDLSKYQTQLMQLSEQASLFAQLNAGLIDSGLLLHVPKGITLKRPIHLVHYHAGQQADMQNLCHLLIADEQANVTVFEEYLGEGEYFNNIVTKIFADRQARVQHYKLQNESEAASHIANVQVFQQAASEVSTFHFNLGARLARDDLHYDFQAERAQSRLYGLYLANAQQQLDSHTRVDHAVSHAESGQIYKGIVTDQAKAIFNGKVVVHEKTVGTIAHQANRNLSLSKRAEIDTKPELEIYADDVQCSHGATVGELDQQSIFYLQSRGIPKEKARYLLAVGFVTELVDFIHDDFVRERVRQCVMKKLEKMV